MDFKSITSRLKYGIFGATLLCSVPLFSAFADDITIQDTSGFTRATSPVEGSSAVDFNLVGPTGAAADGASVTLTNAATGEVLTATSLSGTATFQGVTPGVWTVATTSQGVVFTNVAIVSAVATGTGIAAGALVPVLAVGGGAGAAVAISNDDDDDDEMSPSS